MSIKKLDVTAIELGPLQTNTYILSDAAAGAAVVVDPAWGGNVILEAIERLHCRLEGIWVTHAHFDHIGAVSDLQAATDAEVEIVLHKADLPLWQERGGADRWGVTGYRLDHQPTRFIAHGETLTVGAVDFEVRHTPGHSPGHVVFVNGDAGLVCCGDLIFRDGVGRTDLVGGNWEVLLESIRSQIFTLPDSFRLLPGHGEETTIGHERMNNPYLQDGDLRFV